MSAFLKDECSFQRMHIIHTSAWTLMTATVKQRVKTTDMLRPAWSKERGVWQTRTLRKGSSYRKNHRLSFFLCICGRSKSVVDCDLTFGTSHIAHIAQKQCWANLDQMWSVVGPRHQPGKGRSPPELSGWGQQCRGDNLRGLAALLHGSLEGMLPKVGTRVRAG